MQKKDPSKFLYRLEEQLRRLPRLKSFRLVYHKGLVREFYKYWKTRYEETSHDLATLEDDLVFGMRKFMDWALQEKNELLSSKINQPITFILSMPEEQRDGSMSNPIFEEFIDCEANTEHPPLLRLKRALKGRKADMTREEARLLREEKAQFLKLYADELRRNIAAEHSRDSNRSNDDIRVDAIKAVLKAHIYPALGDRDQGGAFEAATLYLQQLVEHPLGRKAHLG
jgi:hypothetical protein